MSHHAEPDPPQRLTPEEARTVIKAIEEVEKEEAEALDRQRAERESKQDAEARPDRR
jgi:hypothetical protein